MDKKNRKTNTQIPVVHNDDVMFFLNLCKDLDDNFYRLLRKALIPNDIKNNKTHYVYLPETTIKNLILLLGENMPIDQFTVLISQQCRAYYIPQFIKQLNQPDSFQSAIKELSQNLKLRSSHSQLYTQYAGEKWWLVREKEGINEEWFEYAEIFSVIFMYELLTLLTNGKWSPSEIGIQSKNAEKFIFIPGLENAIFFTERPVTAFYIPDDIINMPMSLTKNLTPPLVSTSPQASHDFLDSFKLAITPYLSTGKLPIKIASDILGMNVRTLQRRLKNEGVIYSEVIEEIILEKTIYLLKSPHLSIMQIASMMGYSDSAHFTRAFKRTMNITPSKFRTTLNE
ncbi:AraC family transcriptional regulator [Aliivibrio sp. 1S128]|uniref:helix-turn-helix domain-containing protein n=1 Tax=Aliivibrio sp. 1S128 TaxID=1840085 RepID=UPI0009F313D0|nr:helix-turn-helix transcriptional regulator [Aliivibrio sp. 1S128]